MTFHLPGPIVIASVVLGVIAAILPARCAARLKVIEALAGEYKEHLEELALAWRRIDQPADEFPPAPEIVIGCRPRAVGYEAAHEVGGGGARVPER